MKSVALDQSLSDYNHISEYTLEQNGQVIRWEHVQLQQIGPGIFKVVKPTYIPITLQKTIRVALNPHKHLASLVFSIQPSTGATGCTVLLFCIFFIVNEVKYTFVCLQAMKFYCFMKCLFKYFHQASLMLSDLFSFACQSSLYIWVQVFGWVFTSVAQLCPTLCNGMDCSKPGFPVHHQLPELAQTHVHRVGDAIQPSHPLSSTSSPAFNLFQQQGLFQRVSSSHQVAKALQFQLQHQSFQ